MITKSVRRTIAISFAVGLTLAGCSSAPQESSNASVEAGLHAAAPRAKAPSPTPLPEIATAAPAQHPGIKLAINSLQRDSAGVVILTWTLTNNSKENFNASAGTFNSISKYAGTGVTDVTLLDAGQKVRYHTLRDAKTNYCVCTVMGVTGSHTIVEPGKSATYYDAYTLPSNTSKVTVEIPGFVGVKDVTIS